MAMAIFVESSYSFYDAQLGLVGRGANDDDGLLVGDMIDPYEELSMDSESESESESLRRSLAGRSYISYCALMKNMPCSRRGHSYYN